MTEKPRPKIHEQVKSPTEITFGKHFSDHMLLCHWDRDGGWEKPRIVPYGDIPLSPALSALHYATEVRQIESINRDSPLERKTQVHVECLMILLQF